MEDKYLASSHCRVVYTSFVGSIITVTQMVDGGWWEGALNGDTGWFPSNFVKEFGVLDTGECAHLLVW